MKKLFFAGNWKSNKTVDEAQTWIRIFINQYTANKEKFVGRTIVICAPFTALAVLKSEVQKAELPVFLGAQNVSPFDEGAYTGEVTATMIKELADWVIIGHSERRKYFGESNDVLQSKVGKAKTAGLKVIYCVQDEHTPVPKDVDIVAYEPVWAIGTGKTDTPENANAVVKAIKKSTSVQTVIYGGSVTDKNVASFIAAENIDGVLPGGASLNPEIFARLIIV